MNYTTWEESIQEAGVAVEGETLSVYRAFEQVQDGRHKCGVRYSVALILTLIVLDKLAGMTTPTRHRGVGTLTSGRLGLIS
jgi:hypothetical protein